MCAEHLHSKHPQEALSSGDHSPHWAVAAVSLIQSISTYETRAAEALSSTTELNNLHQMDPKPSFGKQPPANTDRAITSTGAKHKLHAA